MIAEHGVDVASQRLPQSCDKLQGCDEIAVGAPAKIPGENAKVVLEIVRQLGGPLERALAQIRMQIAQMKDGETVEARRQGRQTDRVAFHDDLGGVRPAAPVGSAPPQDDFDHRLHDRHVLEVQESEALPECLRLMFALQSQTQAHMQAAQPTFQPQQDFPRAQELTVFHCRGGSPSPANLHFDSADAPGVNRQGIRRFA